MALNAGYYRFDLCFQNCLRNGTDIPLAVYEKFIKEWIEDYKEPTKDCVDEADELLQETVSKDLEIVKFIAIPKSRLQFYILI